MVGLEFSVLFFILPTNQSSQPSDPAASYQIHPLFGSFCPKFSSTRVRQETFQTARPPRNVLSIGLLMSFVPRYCPAEGVHACVSARLSCFRGLHCGSRCSSCLFCLGRSISFLTGECVSPCAILLVSFPLCTS